MTPKPLLRALLAAAAVAGLSAAAFAAPHGILWAPGARASLKGAPRVSPNATSGLRYFGGPVIASPKVYAVFWGDGIDPQITSKIGAFYANMLDSTYMDWLKEYDTNGGAVDGRPGTKQHIGRGAFGGAFTIHPANSATSLTDDDVQKELDAQIAAGHLPANDANTLYMTYFPSGVSISIAGQASCSSFCAYHEGFQSARSGQPVYYGVMPSCGWGCGGDFDSVTSVSSHECIEAVTDPFPTPGDKPAYPQAWNDDGGQEIADLCQDGSSTVTGRGLTSTVSWLWDNTIPGCNKGPWTQSPASFRTPAPRALPPIPLADSLRAPARVFAGR